VQDLGEEKLPEPASSASSSTSEPQAAPDSEKEPPTSTASQEPTEPPIELDTSTTLPEGTSSPHPVTTERKPMHIPTSVHVRITPENLKEYVGPPVYQKDRMYAYMPPPGVSTGLGYLGNGSGAVMPIEAMVRHVFFFSKNYVSCFVYLLFFHFRLAFTRVCPAKAACN
jgi:Lon-like ATP-dependent protease